MNHKSWLVAFTLLVPTTCSLAAESDQPNIIIFMVDDLGWNHIGVDAPTMGTHDKRYVTPNLAKFAEQGLSFTHAYAQPNCAPTRAAMLSGQYPARIHNGVYVVGNLNRNGRGGISKEKAKFVGPDQSEDVAAEAVTIAEALKKMATPRPTSASFMSADTKMKPPCLKTLDLTSTSVVSRKGTSPLALPVSEKALGGSRTLVSVTSIGLDHPTTTLT